MVCSASAVLATNFSLYLNIPRSSFFLAVYSWHLDLELTMISQIETRTRKHIRYKLNGQKITKFCLELICSLFTFIYIFYLHYYNLHIQIIFTTLHYIYIIIQIIIYILFKKVLSDLRLKALCQPNVTFIRNFCIKLTFIIILCLFT